VEGDVRHFRAGIIIVACMLAVFPLYWQVVGSFTDNKGILVSPPSIIPRGYNLENYQVIVTTFAIFRWVWNSVVVCVGTVALQLATALPAAYALELKPFRGARVVWMAFLVSMMFAGQLSLIPLYKLIRALGLTTSRLGLVVPSCFSAFAVFALRAYLKDFPREVVDAAALDGAGECRTLLGIVVPMCIPLLAALGSMAAVGVWNAYLWQSLIANTDRTRTLLIGVTRVVWDAVFYRNVVQDIGFTDYGILMAGAMIVFAPMGLLFTFSHRYVMKGLYAGREKT
jgi:ABC-type glycerol-3-phosphate transport system permease component